METTEHWPFHELRECRHFQNQHEGSSIYHWVHWRTRSFGGIFDYTQLNVENRENQVGILTFNSIRRFCDRDSGFGS